MLRRALLLLALPVLILVAPSADAAVAPSPGSVSKTERFGTYLWWQGWGLPRSPWNAGVVPDGEGGGFLRVRITKGTHNGTSFHLPTGDADEVTLRYRMRVDGAFDPSRSASNVKLPGFGTPVHDAAGVCTVGCGGAAADGVTGWSARSDVNANGRPGFYVYDLATSYGRGLRWAAPRFTPGVWHDVELHVRMNTPGVADGVLSASVDGVPVFASSRLEMRSSADLHVGGAWFDVYYGGSGVSPATTFLDFDDVQVVAHR